jgi:hypothetical protein
MIRRVRQVIVSSTCAQPCKSSSQSLHATAPASQLAPKARVLFPIRPLVSTLAKGEHSARNNASHRPARLRPTPPLAPRDSRRGNSTSAMEGLWLGATRPLLQVGGRQGGGKRKLGALYPDGCLWPLLPCGQDNESSLLRSS